MDIVDQIEEILGYRFKDVDLLNESLTHPSYKHISGSNKDYNRLEFLGDSVVNLIISELIYKQHPNITEGELSILHSMLVNKVRLAEISKKLGLNLLIYMDQGEDRNGGRDNRNNLEDTMEAVVGAIFLDSDYDTARSIVTKIWEVYLKDAEIEKDSKSALQEWLQKNNHALPKYTIVLQTGLAHKPEFTIEVEIHDGLKFRAKSFVKKEAEFEAASIALKYIHDHCTSEDSTNEI